MHPTDKRTQFIELRAQGWSIHKIARTIDVPKSTLADWQKQEQPRIEELKQMADEAREEEMLETMQRDQEKVSARLALVEQQLDEQLRAKIDSLSLMELCRLSSALRSQLHKTNPKSGKATFPRRSDAPDQSNPCEAPRNLSTISDQQSTNPETGHFRTKPDAPEAPNVREPDPTPETEQNGLPSLALAAEGTATTKNGTLVTSTEQNNVTPGPVLQSQNTAHCSPVLQCLLSPNMKSISDEIPAAGINHSARWMLSYPHRAQLPPKPAPPERMIGHKIDPDRIIGRKTAGSSLANPNR